MRFLIVTTISMLSIVLAYALGSDGYEATLATMYFFLVVFIIQTLRAIFVLQKHMSWWVKAISTVILVIVTALVSAGPVGFLLAGDEINTQNRDISISTVLLVGVLLHRIIIEYVYPESGLSRAKELFRPLHALYAVVTLFITFLIYVGTETNLNSVLLMVMAELVLLSRFVVLKTNYLQWSLSKFGVGSEQKWSEQKMLVAIFTIGMPLMIPLLFIIFGATQ